LEISGSIKINGETLKSLDSISSVSGYVQQDDLFVGQLTVKEHLIFQVDFSLRKKSFKRQKY
jgi:ABC-type multidrug transport system ATPase subunit